MEVPNLSFRCLCFLIFFQCCNWPLNLILVCCFAFILFSHCTSFPYLFIPFPSTGLSLYICFPWHFPHLFQRKMFPHVFLTDLEIFVLCCATDFPSPPWGREKRPGPAVFHRDHGSRRSRGDGVDVPPWRWFGCKKNEMGTLPETTWESLFAPAGSGFQSKIGKHFCLLVGFLVLVNFRHQFLHTKGRSRKYSKWIIFFCCKFLSCTCTMLCSHTPPEDWHRTWSHDGLVQMISPFPGVWCILRWTMLILLGCIRSKRNTYGCFLKWWYPHFTPQNDHF